MKTGEVWKWADGGWVSLLTGTLLESLDWGYQCLDLDCSVESSRTVFSLLPASIDNHKTQ